jgi:hypothetical protein
MVPQGFSTFNGGTDDRVDRRPVAAGGNTIRTAFSTYA